MGAVAERDIREVEDQAVPVRAADKTIVERAEADRGSARVRHRTPRLRLVILAGSLMTQIQTRKAAAYSVAARIFMFATLLAANGGAG
jgi:hypothetical protein